MSTHACPNCDAPCDCTEVFSERDLGLCKHDCDQENPSTPTDYRSELSGDGSVVLAVWYENTPTPTIEDLFHYLRQFPLRLRVRLDDPLLI